MSEITDWAAVVIAVAAVVLSGITLYWQRRHDRLTAKPLGTFEYLNTATKIGVKLWNNGSGPLIIKSVEISGTDNKFHAWSKDFFKLLQGKFPRSKSKNIVRTELKGNAIIAGNSVTLIMCKIDPDDPYQKMEKEAIRLILNDFTQMRITYADIYGNEFNQTNPFEETFRNCY
jgi:hypothetical protein